MSDDENNANPAGSSGSSNGESGSSFMLSPVVADAPAQSMGIVYQTMAHSLSLSMQNAITDQNSINQIGTAVVSKACAQILAIGSK